MVPPATRTLWQGKLFRQLSASIFGCGDYMLEQHRQVVALCHRVLFRFSRLPGVGQLGRDRTILGFNAGTTRLVR